MTAALRSTTSFEKNAPSSQSGAVRVVDATASFLQAGQPASISQIGERIDRVDGFAPVGAGYEEPHVQAKPQSVRGVVLWSLAPPALLVGALVAIAPDIAFANAPVVAALACGLAVGIGSIMTQSDR